MKAFGYSESCEEREMIKSGLGKKEPSKREKYRGRNQSLSVKTTKCINTLVE